MKRWFYHLICFLGRPPLMLASRALIAGRENIPACGGCFLAVNHTHYFDVVMVMAGSTRPVRWLSMTQVSQGKWRWFMELIGTIPLRRGKADVRAARDLLQAVRDGDVAGVFPEARIRRGNDRMTHGGSVDDSLCRLARTASVPILPCVVAGSEHFATWRNWLPVFRTRWAVVFGPVLPPETVTPDTLTAAMRLLYWTASHHAYPDKKDKS